MDSIVLAVASDGIEAAELDNKTYVLLNESFCIVLNP